MISAVRFLVLYILALSFATLLFFGGVEFIKSCGTDSNPICDGFRWLGGGVTMIGLCILTFGTVAASELWLINRRLRELGRDPRGISTRNKLFGTALLISLVLPASKERSGEEQRERPS